MLVTLLFGVGADGGFLVEEGVDGLALRVCPGGEGEIFLGNGRSGNGSYGRNGCRRVLGLLGRLEVGARGEKGFAFLIGNEVGNDAAVLCDGNLEVDDALRLLGGESFQGGEDGGGFFGAAGVGEGGVMTRVAGSEVHPAAGDGERAFVRRGGDELGGGLQGRGHEVVGDGFFPVGQFRHLRDDGDDFDDPFDPRLVDGGGVFRGGEGFEFGEEGGLVVGVGFQIREESC